MDKRILRKSNKMSKLDKEFNTKKEHTFWVITSRNCPGKFVISDTGQQIYLDPVDAKHACNKKNDDVRNCEDIKSDPYRVQRIKVATFQETDSG